MCIRSCKFCSQYWLLLLVNNFILEWNQAVRNEKDLESLNVPAKFRSMNSFWKYYSGEKVAPFPTIFIGGNHEASNYLWELWVTFLTHKFCIPFNWGLDYGTKGVFTVLLSLLILIELSHSRPTELSQHFLFIEFHNRLSIGFLVDVTGGNNVWSLSLWLSGSD